MYNKTMIKFNKLFFIDDLLLFSPRQGGNALNTADYIEKTLKTHRVSFVSEKFQTQVPLTVAVLKVDGKKMSCEGCSFLSGKILGKDAIASSLIPSRFLIDFSNINFNPKCNGISVSNFYFSPSIAVSRKDISTIIKAKKIFGQVKVKKYKGPSKQILVGNNINPKNIIFGHYDSIGPGATDNASGVATMMSVIVNNHDLLKSNLFVFDGNEELSYDYPTYWGRGYRIFEKRYKGILEKAKKIFVVDCVGNGKTSIINDQKIANLAFPIRSIEKIKEKVFIISGSMERLMRVYHSEKDVAKEVKKMFLDEAENLLAKELMKK